MTTTAAAVEGRPTRRLALTAATAALPSGLVCAMIAVLAGAAGVPSIPRLGVPAVALFAVIGAVAGAIGWQVVRRRVADPRRVLGRLVPAVLLLSFLPDVALGVATTVSAGMAPVLTLASMHLVTALIAVPVSARLLPLRRASAVASSPTRG